MKEQYINTITGSIATYSGRTQKNNITEDFLTVKNARLYVLCK